MVLPLPWGEGWGEGEGISLSFTALFSAVGPGLDSTENSEEPKFPAYRLDLHRGNALYGRREFLKRQLCIFGFI